MRLLYTHKNNNKYKIFSIFCFDEWRFCVMNNQTFQPSMENESLTLVKRSLPHFNCTILRLLRAIIVFVLNNCLAILLFFSSFEMQSQRRQTLSKTSSTTITKNNKAKSIVIYTEWGEEIIVCIRATFEWNVSYRSGFQKSWFIFLFCYF